MPKQKTVKMQEDVDFVVQCHDVSLKSGLWHNPDVHLKIRKGSEVNLIRQNKETKTVAIDYDDFSFEFTLKNAVFTK